MSEARQTKCPHCASVFRVSNEQLAAKGGNVRCGSCLQVFRADLHLLGAQAPAQAVQRPAQAAAQQTKPKAHAHDESWALELIGDDAEASADDGRTARSSGSRFADDVPESSFIASSPTGGRDRGIRFDDELSDLLDDNGSGLVLGEDDSAPHNASADESWAQGILSELEQEEHKEKQKQYGMEIIRDDQPKKAPMKNAKLAAALGQRVDEPAEPVSGGSKARAKPADDLGDFDATDIDALDFLNEDPIAAPDVSSSSPFELERPLANVDSPVQLKPRRDPIRWGRILTWTFLSLVALSMLIAQYIYFNFNDLSADSRYRPHMEQVCEKFGCVLPEIPDITKLKIDNLLIRPHPNVNGALQVDAIVNNTATFAQPFPGLHLKFTNRNDEVLSSRTLQPTEYLHGELSKLRRIPPSTPVRISVSVINPGDAAVNYSLQPIF